MKSKSRERKGKTEPREGEKAEHYIYKVGMPLTGGHRPRPLGACDGRTTNSRIIDHWCRH